MLAITWYDWYLTAHILGSVIWVGGGTMLVLLAILTMRADDPQQLAKLGGQIAWIGAWVFTPISLIVVAFGFGLVERGNLGYDHFYVQFGIVAWAVSALTGIAYLGPESGKVGRLISERGPDDGEAQARLRRVLLVARLDVVLLLAIVFVMSAKP